MEELCKCEKETIAVKRTGNKGVEQAQAKINAMTTRLAETTLDHEKEMEEMGNLSNKQLRDVEAKAEKEARVFIEAHEEAVSRIQAAEARKTKAEAEAKVLEMQMRELWKMIDQQASDVDAKCAEIKRRTDEQVTQINVAADKRVSDLSSFAEDVRSGTLATIDELQGLHERGIGGSDERAAVRSKFHEMLGLTKMLEDRKMTQSEYEDARSKVLGTWHSEWDKSQQSTASPKNSNPMTPLSASLSSNDKPSTEEDILRSHLLSKLDI